MDELRETAEICKVLSVETRLRILALLKKRSLCVNALAEHLGITSAAVSQHLRILRNAGAVIPEKQGYFVHYRVDPEILWSWGEKLRGVLEKEVPGEKPSLRTGSCHQMQEGKCPGRRERT